MVVFEAGIQWLIYWCVVEMSKGKMSKEKKYGKNVERKMSKGKNVESEKCRKEKRRKGKMLKGKNTERKNNKTEICRNTDPHVKTCRNEK